ncbi:MAG: sle [Actinomycetia bacterium]|nr:sle [Actinomycetes bacterium]
MRGEATTSSVNRMRRRLAPFLARFFGPVEVTCELFDGQQLRVVLPEIVGTDLYRHGFIEAPLTQMLLERLRPGMVFVDVGAQYGYFTVVASRLVQPFGTVIAFEPGKHAAALLMSNVAHLPGVVVEQAALHTSGGTVELTDYGPQHSALNTVLGGARVPARERRRLQPQTYDVPAVSLDEYAATHHLRPDIVKLDAEGAEVAILTGMHDVLHDVRPIVVLETGDYDGMVSPTTAASIDLLEHAGYACFEYAGGLRPHRRRAQYGYGNLFFLPASAA